MTVLGVKIRELIDGPFIYANEATINFDQKKRQNPL